MRGDLVIGIDSSTTATEAIAWDARGRAVAGKPVKTFRPRTKQGSRYRDLLAIYTGLYSSVRDVSARLYDFAEKGRP